MNDLNSAWRALPQTEAELRFEAEMAALIVDVLHLEITPSAIIAEEPLFRDGLGLDSIDALELALALSKRYGVKLRSDDPRSQEIFASLRSLSRFIASEHSP
ncbi:MAG: phosphopantetheine-binding protein [Acetobacteraceae bacterium]